MTIKILQGNCINKLKTIDLSANTNINNEALINKLNLKELK